KTQRREIDRLSQSTFQPAMPDVADNADDFVRLFIHPTQEQTAPHRVFACEVESRELVADQDDFRIVAHIRFVEISAFSQRDAHGAEIVVIDVAYISVWRLSGGRLRAALDFERKVSGLSGQRKLRDKAGGLDAGQRRYALLQLFEK